MCVCPKKVWMSGHLANDSGPRPISCGVVVMIVTASTQYVPHSENQLVFAHSSPTRNSCTVDVFVQMLQRDKYGQPIILKD
jgi:hypothetical protein